MSFELYFAARDKPLALDALKSWFSGRKHYDLEQLDHDQAFYENSDTGVHFIIEFGEIFDPNDKPELDQEVEANLLLNYSRPSFFAHECLLELSDFIQHFDLLTSNPQEDEEVFSEFGAESFLNSYTSTNHEVQPSLLINSEQSSLRLPTATLREIWQWNFEKQSLQDKLGDDIFTPTKLVFEYSRKFETGVVWTDGIFIAIPPCEVILMNKTELSNSEEPDLHLCLRAEIEPLLSEYFRPTENREYLLPINMKNPEPLRQAFSDLKGTKIITAVHHAASFVDK